MAITLKRQLNDDEKQTVLKTHGRMCFANGHPIPEGESIQFDHIKAFSLGGPSELDNIAPMCGQHNKEKGVLPLFDFRIKLRLQDFFAKGDKLTLKNLLESLKQHKDIPDFGQPISVNTHYYSVTVE
jgi:5-methylcytosine-specific restriction endonuclease McrA